MDRNRAAALPLQTALGRQSGPQLGSSKFGSKVRKEEASEKSHERELLAGNAGGVPSTTALRRSICLAPRAEVIMVDKSLGRQKMPGA